MNTVKVRDIEIGAGAPKIIVPIVGVTKNDIIEEAKTFHSIPVDVVEWRVDWFEGVFDFAQVEDVLKDLREALGNIPLLMTFRTSKEGGEKAIEPAAYAELNIKAAQTGYVDLVDVEIFTGDDIVKKIIDGAHAAGVKVIASNHDFFKTPAKADIIYRLRKMQDMNADIPKIADYTGACHRHGDDRSVRIIGGHFLCCRKQGQNVFPVLRHNSNLRNIRYKKMVELAQQDN